LEGALDRAKAEVEVARRRLAKVKAGAKEDDISALEAEIVRQNAAFENAQSEYRRYATLRETGDVTVSALESKRTTMLVAQQAREEAQHRLRSLREVSPADVDLAQAQLQAAIAEEERDRRDYEASAIYAPADGQVLKIRAHTGEQAGPDGILELGRTKQMYVAAEVYETDVRRVRPGQKARITGDLLSAPMEGTVERIGMQVKAPSVVLGDPAAFSDSRIIEVKVRLFDGQAAASLVGGKVYVVIHP
jgi:HlyD family secretion protein